MVVKDADLPIQAMMRLKAKLGLNLDLTSAVDYLDWESNSFLVDWDHIDYIDQYCFIKYLLIPRASKNINVEQL